MTAAQPSKQKSGLSYRQQQWLERAAIYAVLGLAAIVVIVPLVWMVSTSLKLKSQLFLTDIYWIPKTITLENYTKLLNNPATPIVRWFLNTIGVATVSTIAVLFIDSLAGYAYARLEFPGRNQLFALLLATLFLPGVMFLVPNFVTTYRLELLNNYAF